MKSYSFLFVSVTFLILACGSGTKTEDAIIAESRKISESSELNVIIRGLKQEIQATSELKKKADISIRIAEIEADKGNFTEAVKAAEESVRLNQNKAEANYIIAKSHMSSGEYFEAEKKLKEAIEIKKDNPAALFEMGNTYYKKGDYPKAMEAYEKSLKYDDKNYMAHNNLGVLYYLTGKYTKSETELKRVIQLKPDFASAYKNLGILYDLKLNKKNLAVNYYKEYLKFSPNAAEKAAVNYWISSLGGSQ